MKKIGSKLNQPERAFNQILLDCVNAHEEISISQVLAQVGWHITAVRAQRQGGKRDIVINALGRLTRDGKIQRLRQGVYGRKVKKP